MWCPGCKRSTWFKQTEKCHLATRGDFKKRNRVDKWSPLLIQSWLGHWQSFSYFWTRSVLAVQHYSSPTELNICPYCANVKHHLPLWFHVHREVNWRFPVTQRCQGDEWGRKNSKNKQVEANKTHLFLCQKKMLKCKISPPAKKN